MILVTYVDDWLSNMAARGFFEDILVVEEAGVPGENHRPWTSNW
jgi:hypothetical protein